MYIGKVKIEGTAALAPMAGITDRAFREICSSFGSAYSVSEMISVKGIIYNDKKTLNLVNRTRDDKPFAIQLFGREPEDFLKAYETISKLNHDILDINMGCPAPKITKSGSGSALMLEPKLCGQIVKAIKKVSKVPVTVKIRIGFDNKHITALEVAKECEFSGANAITVHGRTREQMYSGKSDLDVIKSVCEQIKIPVIGNGDITNYDDAKHMMEYTGCKMVAVGRSALGNPWIFKNINNHDEFSAPTNAEKVETIKAHAYKLIEHKGEERALKEFRKHMSWYTKGLSGAATIRKEIFEMKNINDLNTICDKILNIN